MLVDPVEIGIALEDELLGRRLGGVDPGVERRQLGVLRPVLAAMPDMQLPPVLVLPGLRPALRAFPWSWYFSWNCFMIVRREQDRRRLRRGKRSAGNSDWAPPNSYCTVNSSMTLEFRRLALRHQLGRQATGIADPRSASHPPKCSGSLPWSAAGRPTICGPCAS